MFRGSIPAASMKAPVSGSCSYTAGMIREDISHRARQMLYVPIRVNVGRRLDRRAAFERPSSFPSCREHALTGELRTGATVAWYDVFNAAKGVRPRRNALFIGAVVFSVRLRRYQL
jgi:hypothetical protein